jgi:hypothetical protein
MEVDEKEREEKQIEEKRRAVMKVAERMKKGDEKDEDKEKRKLEKDAARVLARQDDRLASHESYKLPDMVTNKIFNGQEYDILEKVYQKGRKEGRFELSTDLFKDRKLIKSVANRILNNSTVVNKMATGGFVLNTKEFKLMRI